MRVCLPLSPRRWRASPCVSFPDHPLRTSPQAPCLAGTYAPTAAMSVCAGCPAGSYCVANASATTPCGSVSVFCPVNATAPVSVGDGNYSLPRTVDVTVRTGQAPCPVGNFCVAGDVFLCNAGTYSNVTGASGACTACPPGAYCPAGSVNVVRDRDIPVAWVVSVVGRLMLRRACVEFCLDSVSSPVDCHCCCYST